MAYNRLSLHFITPHHLFPVHFPAGGRRQQAWKEGRAKRNFRRWFYSIARNVLFFFKIFNSFVFATSDVLRGVALPITNRKIPNNP
jgi:hypothetical protein